MAIFDTYITSVARYVEKLKNEGAQVRELFVDSTVFERHCLNSNSSNINPAVGTRPGQSIVLKSDTFLELGSPAAGSCAITIYSDNPSLLSDGRIVLVGPDVKELPTKELPFGQVVITAGRQLNDGDYHQLLQCQNVSDQLDGYMIRNTTENIWSRISRQAADKGFNFELLGAALIQRIRSEISNAESVEILFVTSSREDVLGLNEIGAPVRELARSIKEKIWLARGIDIFQCNPGGHCGSCTDKSVCDDLKKIGVERRKMQQHL